MTDRESKIQKDIIEYLEKDRGAYVLKIVKANKAGVPDIVFCLPTHTTTQDGTTSGQFWGIEVKRKGEVASKLQKYHLQLIRNSGGRAFVAYSVLDVELELPLP